MPVGTLSAFAPTNMTTLTVDRLPKPNIYAELTEGDRMTLFQASLTDDQWRKLTSEDGLGGADLKPEQRDLFLALLPNPIVARRIIDDSGPEPKSESLTLADDQRGSVRLRQYKRLMWDFHTEKGGGSISMGRAYGTPWGLNYRPQVFGGTSGDVVIFGVKVKETGPNRQKRSNLRYDGSALDPKIPLTGAATVGEIVDRIRKATRVEIYADRRYTDQTVYIRGDYARAGDILRAFALCVTGTYRQVGPAYVLTDDLSGLGVRHALLNIWAGRALGSYRDVVDSVLDTADKLPTERIGWDEKDPMRPGDALLKRMANRPRIIDSRKDRDAGMVPINELPAAAQTEIVKQLEDLRTSQSRSIKQENDTIRADAVLPYGEIATELIVPGIGSVRANELTMFASFHSGRRTGLPNGDDAPPPLIADLSNIPKRGIVVAPRTEAEAVKAVIEAKRRGFTTLWIAVTPSETKPLEAAIRAGKEAGIPIVAAVRVLRSNGDKTLPADVNILGEMSTAAAGRLARDGPALSSGGLFIIKNREQDNRRLAAGAASERKRDDWLRPDLPNVRVNVAARVAAIARVPGLAGLTLLDLVPPGYHDPALWSQGMAPFQEDGYGYSEETRLGFLRQSGVDPIDLIALPGQSTIIIPPAHFKSLNLPSFPDYGLTGRYGGQSSHNGVDTYTLEPQDAHEKWLEMRAAIGNAWIRQLVTKIQEIAPNLPLYSATRGGEVDTINTWRWLALLEPGKAADYLAPAMPNQIRFSGETIHTGAKESWLVAPYLPETDGDPKLSFALQMQQAFGIGSGPLTRGWDGVLLDLSESSVDSAFSLLDAVIKMPDNSPKPPP